MSACDSLCVNAIVAASRTPIFKDPNFWITTIGTICSAGSIAAVLWINEKVVKALTRRHRRDTLNRMIEITQSISNLNPQMDFDQANTLAWKIHNEFSRISGLFDSAAKTKFRIQEIITIINQLIGIIEGLRPQNSTPVSSQTVYNGCSQAYFTLNSELHSLIGLLEASEDKNG